MYSLHAREIVEHAVPPHREIYYGGIISQAMLIHRSGISIVPLSPSPGPKDYALNPAVI
jgi:hypothetical protein